MPFANGPVVGAPSALSWAVHVTAEEAILSSQVASGDEQRTWPPIASTLILGERDAVLVDPARGGGELLREASYIPKLARGEADVGSQQSHSGCLDEGPA